MEIAKGETTEKELDAMIRRRHDQRVQTEGERAEPVTAALVSQLSPRDPRGG